MPFKSEAQRKFMYANHPTIAARWSAEEARSLARRKKKKEPHHAR